ncbi:hypothetical protein [uncultured Sunxiuqinia sp.]|uniref:arsenate reductase/protein-tyrosine-phosphatase family protein n=1 Tax=uncultured Sunxiuqinia sp. TaxID=1573825 RepID=UPI0030D7CC73
MTILFLCSGSGSCKSLMAKTILESIDSRQRVLSAGIGLAKEINPLAVQVMKEIGLVMNLADLQPVSALKDEPIDYLITVGENTKEEFHQLPIPYQNKLHLSFSNPDKPNYRYESQLDAYRHLRDEIRTELDYFYHRILKEKAAN